MSNDKIKLGVALYHLKDKFAYGSTSGNEMSEFKFDEKQIASLFEFLRNGAFDGMFNNVDMIDYININDLNFISLSREETRVNVREKLTKEYEKKVKELDDQKEKELNSGKEPQAE